MKFSEKPWFVEILLSEEFVSSGLEVVEIEAR